jgi:hypothetical protein
MNGKSKKQRPIKNMAASVREKTIKSLKTDRTRVQFHTPPIFSGKISLRVIKIRI